MAEWLIAPVLKTGGPQGLGGSNPSPSARLGAVRPLARVRTRASFFWYNTR